MKQVRCAIYTRKSSEEGLEQDFNSLDAQREACAAYVLSQASEGWQQLPEVYDDGGLSGGTLERPALKRLLSDVAAGKVDTIVVYKVDRLTRSLLDFSKLVEAFDKADTSFVSVTQSFNTTTSMGRLTLNMLLSFAQFEREVTAERIRDKLAASKAKGMWMGGPPALGYRPDGRSLAIVEEHAAIVRDIFARYLALGSVPHVTAQLADEGIRSPRRERKTGRAYGGGVFSRGQIYAMLRNPIYAGDIPHRDKIYPGNHPAIIGREMWDAVQRLRASHVKGERPVRAAAPSLLAGLLFDSAGEPLLAAHATKAGAAGTMRYRYYVSRSLHHGTADSPSAGVRLPAREIEQVVVQELAPLFDDPIALASRAALAISPGALPQMSELCSRIASGLRLRGHGCVRQIVSRITVHYDRLDISLSAAATGELLGLLPIRGAPSQFGLTVGVRLTRTGRAIRLVQDGRALTGEAERDASLIRLVVKARQWWLVLARGELTITALALQEGVTSSWLYRVVRLAFLAPDVLEGVLAGTVVPGLDGAALLAPDAIPAGWEEQRKRFLA